MHCVCSGIVSGQNSAIARQTQRSGAPLNASAHRVAAVTSTMPFLSDATDTLLRPPSLQPVSKPGPAIGFLDHTDIFVCDEESDFYSACLADLVFSSDQYALDPIIEFGSGDGSPVLNALRRCPFSGTVHGFELNAKAAAMARSSARAMRLQDNYEVHNSCFFRGAAAMPAATLVANPPYIAAPDDDILMPALHGGPDGANLTRELMSLGFESAMLLLCSYCDPVRTLAHAKNEGYAVVDFKVTDLPFGEYSAEPKVLSWIRGMRADGRAFFSDSSYRLAGALLQKQAGGSAMDADTSGGSSVDGSSAFSCEGRGSGRASSTGSTGSTDIDRTSELLAALMAA